MTTQTSSGDETKKLGKEFAKKIADGGVVCLYGNLGAGKTTFTQGVAEGLGIKEKVVSPTFILIRRYSLARVGKYLYHIDLYRLNSLEEVKGIGIEEILADKGSVVIIEWPEKISDLLPRQRSEIKLEAKAEDTRVITITESI